MSAQRFMQYERPLYFLGPKATFLFAVIRCYVLVVMDTEFLSQLTKQYKQNIIACIVVGQSLFLLKVASKSKILLTPIAQAIRL